MDVDEEVEGPEPNAEHPPTINAVAEPSTDPLENNDNEEIAEMDEVPSGRRSSEDSSTLAPKKRRGSNSNAAVLEILEKSSAERKSCCMPSPRQHSKIQIPYRYFAVVWRRRLKYFSLSLFWKRRLLFLK